MITVRKSEDRGGADLGWLRTRHTFSFDTYHDPRHMGFGDLRVINEDEVAPSGGFPTHPHRNMEILTYLVRGAVAHKDSMGNVSTIPRGEIQVMSAGRGVTHSEFNPSDREPLKLLQIWILPDVRDSEPRYAQGPVVDAHVRNRLGLLVSREGDEGGLPIHQDARVYAAKLDGGREVTWELKPGRRGWIQVVDGSLTANGVVLRAGDGAALADETRVRLAAPEPAEILAFDLK